MPLKESTILILERSFFLLSLNWYLTLAQCLFNRIRMKAIWNMPFLKSHFSASSIPPLMFMQWLLCWPVCPCFPLDAFLSKLSLSLTTCLGAYFGHYTDQTLQTPHCTHHTHLLVIGMALPIWVTPNSPPSTPELFFSSLQEQCLQLLFLQMHSTSIFQHSKII